MKTSFFTNKVKRVSLILIFLLLVFALVLPFSAVYAMDPAPPVFPAGTSNVPAGVYSRPAGMIPGHWLYFPFPPATGTYWDNPSRCALEQEHQWTVCTYKYGNLVAVAHGQVAVMFYPVQPGYGLGAYITTDGGRTYQTYQETSSMVVSDGTNAMVVYMQNDWTGLSYSYMYGFVR